VKSGARFFLLALLGALVLVVTPVAFGDDSTWQLVTPNWDTNCYGFDVESLDGTINSCVSRDGASFVNVSYAAAANGSIVFMAGDCTDPTTCGDQGSIWLVRPDGSSVHLDSDPSDFDPSISYDGSKVVFARFDPATWSSDIYSVNSDGSDLQLVVSGAGTNDLTVPAISPDGSTVAYWCGPARHAASAGEGCGPLTDGSYRPSGLMRVGIDGSNPRMIVIGAGDAAEPGGPSALGWSPDSQWIALDGLLLNPAANESARQLFRYHTDGSDLFNNADPTRQVTHETGGAAGSAQFSPDGTELLYMQAVNDAGVAGNFSYLIGIDGTNRHEVYLDPSGDPSYGEFIPAASPGSPPPLVDMTHLTVPSVHSLGVKAAKTRLLADNLSLGRVTHEYSAKVGKNRVLSQYPRAGAVAHRTQKIGPAVNLTVSRGKRPARKKR